MTKDEVNKTFDRFHTENNGKFVERVDSSALFQCFDLAIYWCEYLGFPKTIFSGLYGAHEIYDKWSNPSFDKIPNTSDYIPLKGDIVVWDGSLNGGIGHVAVATGTGDLISFTSFDQNWIVGSPSVDIIHSYNKVLGAQRLKVTTDTMDNRPYFFDITWLDEHPGVDTKKVTEQQVRDQIALNRTRKTGNGNYDQICNLAGMPTSATPQQVYDKIKSQGSGEDRYKKLKTTIQKDLDSS